MAEVLLFHHALGITPGISAFADELRAAGHVVHVPDLFEGRRFEQVDDGVAHAAEVGFGTIIARGEHAANLLSGEVVHVGWSLGVLPAQKLAQTRPGARGAVLLESCAPVSEFSSAWPNGVPVQVHGMDADPFFAGEGDVDNAKALVASTSDAELFLYTGDRHLFGDESLPTFDADAAALMRRRVLAFLAGL